MRERFITHRIIFFGMVAILAFLALILVWHFTRSILLEVALVIILKPVYNWILHRQWIGGRESRATALTILVFILINQLIKIEREWSIMVSKLRSPVLDPGMPAHLY